MEKDNHELEKERDKRIGEYFLVQERLEGNIVANEQPDLDYHVEGKIIGIELTELAPADSKTRLPGVNRVLNRCRELHSKSQFPAVRCFIDFDTSFQIKKSKADKYAEEIVESLDSALRQFSGSNEVRLSTGLPEGVLSVSIRAPLAPDEPTLYSSPYVVGHEVLRIVHINDRVTSKEKLLTGYRSGLHEYWLIIHFGHLPGEKWFIGPTPDLLKEFPIESIFDRVYLVTPQIEGGVWRIC